MISRKIYAMLGTMQSYTHRNLPHRDIWLEKNAFWATADQEFTPSSSTLSAVWADLRHGTYAWKVVSDSAIDRFAYVRPGTAPDYMDYACSEPEVLACGETKVCGQCRDCHFTLNLETHHHTIIIIKYEYIERKLRNETR